MPRFVQNHGLMEWDKLQMFLEQRVKVIQIYQTCKLIPRIKRVLPGKLALKKDRTDIRSYHREVFCLKIVPKNFAKFTGKHLCWSLFFNKAAGYNFSKFLKTKFV